MVDDPQSGLEKKLWDSTGCSKGERDTQVTKKESGAERERWRHRNVAGRGGRNKHRKDRDLHREEETERGRREEVKKRQRHTQRETETVQETNKGEI